MKRLVFISAALVAAILLSTGCKKEEKPLFSVSKVTLTDVPVAGKTESLTITSNVAWSIAGATEWCTVTPASGNGNGAVTIEVAANEGADARSTTLKVSAEGFPTVDIPVSQAVDNVLNAITDPAFKKWADTNLAGGTGRLSSEEAAKIANVNLYFSEDKSVKDIKSLEGIQNFTDLRALRIMSDTDNQLNIKVAEYISGLKNLEYLNFKFNTVTETLNTKAMSKLKTLDLGRCPNLTLELGEHLLLETASFVGNTKLTSVSFKDYSQLTTLNLSECSALTSLTLDGLPKLAGEIGILKSQLTTVSVSNCGLTLINVSNNAELTTVNVSDCAQLTTLHANNSPKLTTLSVENSLSLNYLHAEDSGLEVLTLKNLPSFKLYWNDTPLKEVTIQNIGLKEIKMIERADLVKLTVNDCPDLASLSFTACSKLEDLDCSKNAKLNALSITGSDGIKKLRVNKTVVGPTIDISPYKSLTEFDCSETSVTTVNTYWEPGKKPATVTTYNIGNATEVKK